VVVTMIAAPAAIAASMVRVFMADHILSALVACERVVVLGGDLQRHELRDQRWRYHRSPRLGHPHV
jgi:hypothetical protein